MSKVVVIKPYCSLIVTWDTHIGDKNWLLGLWDGSQGKSLAKLSVITGTHKKLEGENQLYKSCPLTLICAPWDIYPHIYIMYTHIHNNNDNNNNNYTNGLSWGVHGEGVWGGLAHSLTYCLCPCRGMCPCVRPMTTELHTQRFMVPSFWFTPSLWVIDIKGEYL